MIFTIAEHKKYWNYYLVSLFSCLYEYGFYKKKPFGRVMGDDPLSREVDI